MDHLDSSFTQVTTCDNDVSKTYSCNKEVLLDDLLDTLAQGSLCAHGGGIPLPVKNILKYFEDELKDFFR